MQPKEPPKGSNGSNGSGEVVEATLLPPEERVASSDAVTGSLRGRARPEALARLRRQRAEGQQRAAAGSSRNRTRRMEIYLAALCATGRYDEARHAAGDVAYSTLHQWRRFNIDGFRDREKDAAASIRYALADRRHAIALGAFGASVQEQLTAMRDIDRQLQAREIIDARLTASVESHDYAAQFRRVWEGYLWDYSPPEGIGASGDGTAIPESAGSSEVAQ